MEVREYISQTQHAVNGMFDLLNHYDSLLREAVQATPTFAFRHSGCEVELKGAHDNWLTQPPIQEARDHAEALWEKHSAIAFSRHIISGSILQIAFKAIELFSTNSSSTPELDVFIEHLSSKKRAKCLKFMIGRQVKHVPIGLMIYAGRNQYNHFDEDSLTDKVNIKVFEALAWEDGSEFDDGKDFKNPSFDLEYELTRVRSSIMLSALGWKTYPDYHADMRSLLLETS